MAHIRDRVKHFTTGDIGTIEQVKRDVCLVVFEPIGPLNYGLYAQDEIGYKENANTFLYLIDADGNYITEG